MSDQLPPPPATNTIAADPSFASAPTSNESFEQVLTRQLKNKPKIPRTDLKSLDSIPDIAVPSDVDLISTQDSNEFLNSMENFESPEVKETPEKPEKVKKEKVKEVAQTFEDQFSLDDSDATASVVEPEKPTKKTKEDNIAELRKKAESYEATAKEKEQKLEEFQKKIAELEATLERSDFEKSPVFKEQFKVPFVDALNQAAEFADMVTSDSSLAEKALALSGKDRIDFIDENFGGGAGAAQFLELINKADSKKKNLDEALLNNKDTKKLVEINEEQSKQKTVERITKNFDRVYGQLAQKSPFFQKGDDEDHNSLVERRVEAARNIILGTASKNDQLVAPFLAVIAKDAVAENEKLKAELSKYKNRAREDASVQPRINRSSSDEESESKGKPRSALDAIRSQLRSY
jgi:hypothetical protein